LIAEYEFDCGFCSAISGTARTWFTATKR